MQATPLYTPNEAISHGHMHVLMAFMFSWLLIARRKGLPGIKTLGEAGCTIASGCSWGNVDSVRNRA
jgi:hypothetical protein